MALAPVPASVSAPVVPRCRSLPSTPPGSWFIGGQPFEEHILMWWNSVGREHDNIVSARDAWMRASVRFGTVHGYPGDRLTAPPPPTVRLKRRGRQR